MKSFNDLENDLKLGKTHFTSKELMIKNKNGITFLECLLMTDYKDKFYIVDSCQEMIPILCRYKSRLLLNIPIDYKTLLVKYYKDQTVLDYIKSTNSKFKVNMNFENIVYSVKDLYNIKNSSGALITRFKVVYRKTDPVVRRALENAFRYLNSVNKEESLKYIKALIDLKLKHKDFNIVYNPNRKSCFVRDKNTIYLGNLYSIYTIVHETMHALHYNNTGYDVPNDYYDVQDELMHNFDYKGKYDTYRKRNLRQHGELGDKVRHMYTNLINNRYGSKEVFRDNVVKMIYGSIGDKELRKRLDMEYLVDNYIRNNKNIILNVYMDMNPLFDSLLLIDDITEGQFNDGHLHTGGHSLEYFKNSKSFCEFFADYGTIKLLGLSEECFNYFNEMTGFDIEGMMDDFYNTVIIGENKGKIKKKV